MRTTLTRFGIAFLIGVLITVTFLATRQVADNRTAIEQACHLINENRAINIRAWNRFLDEAVKGVPPNPDIERRVAGLRSDLMHDFAPRRCS